MVVGHTKCASAVAISDALAIQLSESYYVAWIVVRKYLFKRFANGFISWFARFCFLDLSPESLTTVLNLDMESSIKSLNFFRAHFKHTKWRQSSFFVVIHSPSFRKRAKSWLNSLSGWSLQVGCRHQFSYRDPTKSAPWPMPRISPLLSIHSPSVTFQGLKKKHFQRGLKLLGHF